MMICGLEKGGFAASLHRNKKCKNIRHVHSGTDDDDDDGDWDNYDDDDDSHIVNLWIVRSLFDNQLPPITENPHIAG